MIRVRVRARVRVRIRGSLTSAMVTLVDESLDAVPAAALRQPVEDLMLCSLDVYLEHHLVRVRVRVRVRVGVRLGLGLGLGFIGLGLGLDLGLALIGVKVRVRVRVRGYLVPRLEGGKDPADQVYDRHAKHILGLHLGVHSQCASANELLRVGVDRDVRVFRGHPGWDQRVSRCLSWCWSQLSLRQPLLEQRTVLQPWVGSERCERLDKESPHAFTHEIHIPARRASHRARIATEVRRRA